MVDTNAIRGLIAQRRLTQGQVAKMLGITPKTFYTKMKIGRFDTDQAEQLIDILGIENAEQIFFANRGTER